MSEILAPVGNYDMLSPAVFCGANAVYLGLESMNARRSAKGFSPEELKRAVSFCHARNVKVYVALNTIIYASELNDACSAVKSVCEAGADAVIVQDLAMAEIVRRMVPSLSLHGSTQMSVHTLSGALALQKMGFSRVILSRELSLEEIKAITQGCTIETEVFVHGALCMSISGQCYMSAFLGGRSGNRGSCAGPCRLPFSASEPGLCHLSLKDMSHISYLPELEKAGVKSFKIEGRLRSEEYAAAAVNACVCSLAGLSYDTQVLQDVFSRSGFTDGYIKSERDGRMFGVRTPEDTAAAKAAQPKLRELYRRERPCVGVDISLTVSGSRLVLNVQDKLFAVTKEADFEPEAAKNDMQELLSKALAKCGGTPFFAKDISVHGAEGIYVPQSLVNELRRAALEELLLKREELCAAKITEYKAPHYTKQEHEKRGVIARFESLEQMPQSLSGIEFIVLPIELCDKISPELRAKTWLELPRAMFGSLEAEVKKQILKAESMGFAGFTAENIAHFELLNGKSILGGFGLNCSNPLSAAEYRRLGAKIITASCENTLSEMVVLEGETAAIAYAHMPLMLTRACPLHNVHGCAGCTKSGTLLDRKNERMPLSCKNGVRTIYNPVPIYMGDRRSELCTNYDILYFTKEDRGEVEKVIECFLEGKPFYSEFTRGLYYKGTS